MPQLLNTLHQGISNVFHTADAESGVSEALMMQQQKVPLRSAMFDIPLMQYQRCIRHPLMSYQRCLIQIRHR
jgi:hypothetical protein